MTKIPEKPSVQIVTKTIIPLPKHLFYRKFGRNMLIGGLIFLSSLGIGMLGYHELENLTWTDSYANAAMILSGMGPLKDLTTDAGRIFAGTYALFSGILFLVIMALVLAPMLHRFIHHFHMTDSIKK